MTADPTAAATARQAPREVDPRHVSQPPVCARAEKASTVARHHATEAIAPGEIPART
ncbi:MAG: hypothetical protein ACK52I_27140 [Pseudomonadota bacterium]